MICSRITINNHITCHKQYPMYIFIQVTQDFIYEQGTSLNQPLDLTMQP